MDCWASPRAIMRVKTWRCWGRKKSSALRASMAALRALLSTRMAPRMERSASRLLGRARSNEVSASIAKEGTYLRFCYTIIEVSDAKKQLPNKFSGGWNPAPKLWMDCARKKVRRQSERCESRRKKGE